MKRKVFAPGVVVLCAVIFAGGMTFGYLRNKPRKNTDEIGERNIKAVAREEESIPYNEKEKDYYTVVSEGEHIVLYEVFTDNTKREIGRTTFDVRVLPKEANDMLKNSVSFNELDEALMAIENFVS